MLQVKNSSEKVPIAKQNQFDANDMWLPLAEFFFAWTKVHFRGSQSQSFFYLKNQIPSSILDCPACDFVQT
jgi:hypothetical protein